VPQVSGAVRSLCPPASFPSVTTGGQHGNALAEGTPAMTTDAGARTGVWFAQAFPGSPEQVGNVRRAIRFYLGSCPASDDVTLVVSELATNAILHSRSGHGGTFVVRAELHPTWVWIEVEDAGGQWTDRGHTDRSHGLDVVGELAREWGRSNRPHGRTVWARVDF